MLKNCKVDFLGNVENGLDWLNPVASETYPIVHAFDYIQHSLRAHINSSFLNRVRIGREKACSVTCLIIDWPMT